MTMPQKQLPDVDEALGHAVRLLHEAEMENDQLRKEKTLSIADSWLNVASFQFERQL